MLKLCFEGCIGSEEVEGTGQAGFEGVVSVTYASPFTAGPSPPVTLQFLYWCLSPFTMFPPLSSAVLSSFAPLSS